MSDLKICRICLRTDVKMYQSIEYQLKLYYENLLAINMSEEEGLPHYFCFECATMLHKFHKFKEKCLNGQKLLMELLWRGPITYDIICKIDRKSTLIKTPIAEIVIDDKSDAITSTENHSLFIEQSKEMIAKVEDMDIDNLSERSLSDKEDNIHDSKEDSSDDEKLINEDKKDMACSPFAVYVESVCDATNNEFKSNGRKDAYCKAKQSDDATNNISNETDSKSKGKKGANCKTKESESDEIEPKKGKKGTFCKKKVLDSTHWNIYTLNEQDAMKEFKAKGEDPKYVAAAFKCEDCYKAFSKKDMLDRHVHLRHFEQVGNFVCRFCRYRYKLDCYLKKHMKYHYMRYKCLRCGLLCSLESTAVLHEAYHSGVTMKCKYCDEEFRHSSTYYTHLRTHRSEHVCTLCGASFVSKLGLHQHKQIKHIIIELESPDDDEDVNTYCKRCDIRFETRKAFEEHLFHSALHSDEEGQNTDDKVLERKECESRSDSVAPSKKLLGKKVKAKITEALRKRPDEDKTIDLKRIINGKSLRKRQRRQRTKPTTCHQCGKHFETQAACMKHHMEAHPRTSFHPPNERYICEICGSSLAPGSIATHQNMHTREKLHTCDTCGRQFHAIIGLRRHLVTHTGEKPYACPLCDKRFTQSNSMKLHYRTFHLKQPYPKRVRRVRKPNQKKAKESIEDSTSNSDASSDENDAEPVNQPGIKPVDDVAQERPDDNMQYLTLT